MFRLVNIFRDAGWLLLLAIVLLLCVTAIGFRLQTPHDNSPTLDFLNLHCWLYPCSIDRSPKWLWEQNHDLPVENYSPSPYLKLLRPIVTAHEDGEVLVWHSEGERGATVPISLDSQASIVAVSPRGTIVTANERNRIDTWTTDGALVQSIEGLPASPVTALYIGSDDTVATGHFNGDIVVWDRNGKRRQTLNQPWHVPVTAIAISPQGEIAAAYRGGQISMWNSGATTPRNATLPYRDTISALALASDGTLATLDDDGEVLLWRTEESLSDGKRLKSRTPPEFHSPAISISIGTDGTIVVGHRDGTVKLWSTAGEEPKLDASLRLPIDSSVFAMAVPIVRFLSPTLVEGRLRLLFIGNTDDTATTASFLDIPTLPP